MSNDAVASIRGAYLQSPRKSLRTAVRELNMSKYSAQTVLHKLLHFRANNYKLQILKPNDKILYRLLLLLITFLKTNIS